MQLIYEYGIINEKVGELGKNRFCFLFRDLKVPSLHKAKKLAENNAYYMLDLL